MVLYYNCYITHILKHQVPALILYFIIDVANVRNTNKERKRTWKRTCKVLIMTH